MPRKATPANASFDRRLDTLVSGFADELRGLLAAQIVEAVRHAVSEMVAGGFSRTALPTIAHAPSSKPAPARAAAGRPTKKKAAAKKPGKSLSTNEAKRIAGTKPVACPMPGCNNPGVRRFMNFCVEHHASTPKAEQKRLR